MSGILFTRASQYLDFSDIDGGNAQHGGEWGLLLTIVKREYGWSMQKVQNWPGPFIAYFSRWCEGLYLDWRGVCGGDTLGVSIRSYQDLVFKSGWGWGWS